MPMRRYRDELTQALIDLQGSESDRVFAARIGISRPLWCLNRRGVQSMSVGTMRLVAQAFPQLAELARQAAIEEPEEAVA